jgi:sugar/nucleoside kinase (ribokinase family)
MKDICCIGHITLDKIVTPQNVFHQNGGTSFYFAYGINQLPAEVSFQLVTAMAEKDMQAVVDMRRKGIDVLCYPSRETVFFENIYGENQNNRTQKVRAKADPFTVSQLQGVEAKVFHLGSLLADDFSPEVVRMLSERGKVSIDVQGYLREVRGEDVFATHWKDKLDVLKYTDILKLNEHEMEVVTGLSNPRDVARQIADWGVSEVVITLGSYGSLIYTDGHFDEIPAYSPRRVIDATGCGDTYSTGYLYCRAQGMSCLESGKFAAAMAALKLEHSGPFSGSIDDIKTLIAQQ